MSFLTALVNQEQRWEFLENKKKFIMHIDKLVFPPQLIYYYHDKIFYWSKKDKIDITCLMSLSCYGTDQPPCSMYENIRHSVWCLWCTVTLLCAMTFHAHEICTVAMDTQYDGLFCCVAIVSNDDIYGCWYSSSSWSAESYHSDEDGRFI